MMMDQNKPVKKDWAGYTMEELAYRRVLTLARIEIAKERIGMNAEHIKKGNVLLSGSWFSRIMKMIDFTDMFVIGFTLWRKLSPLFSRKKK